MRNLILIFVDMFLPVSSCDIHIDPIFEILTMYLQNKYLLLCSYFFFFKPRLFLKQLFSSKVSYRIHALYIFNIILLVSSTIKIHEILMPTNDTEIFPHDFLALFWNWFICGLHNCLKNLNSIIQSWNRNFKRVWW